MYWGIGLAIPRWLRTLYALLAQPTEARLIFSKTFSSLNVFTDSRPSSLASISHYMILTNIFSVITIHPSSLLPPLPHLPTASLGGDNGRQHDAGGERVWARPFPGSHGRRHAGTFLPTTSYLYKIYIFPMFGKWSYLTPPPVFNLGRRHRE